MMKGNQIYQLFQLPAQQPNLEVRQVLQQHDNEQFQKLEIIAHLSSYSVQDLDDHVTQHYHLVQCWLFLQTSRWCYVLIKRPLASMKATGKVALLQTAPLAISVTSLDISQEWSCVTGGQNCKDQIWPFRSEISIIIMGFISFNLGKPLSLPSTHYVGCYIHCKC